MTASAGGGGESSVVGLGGRVAIVTGGGGNIGSATVALLSRLGASVLAVDIDADKAQRSAEAAREAGGDVIAGSFDARDGAAVDAMVGQTLERWGRLDVGVNIVGGGVGMGHSSLELADEDWAATMEMNLYSAVRCSRAYARAMIDRAIAGSIVNIASPAGLRAAPGMVAYGASKAALINFTWTLAVEVAPHGIRANVVVPAFVASPEMTWGGTAEEQAELARQMVPMGRMTAASDVAGAIVTFASNLTSYSTGQVIVCDGGRLLTNPINPGSRS